MQPNTPTAKRIVLVTCNMWPALSTSDGLLAEELRRHGHDVVVASWNGSALETFLTADVVVLRSNWDFHHHLAEFRQWLAALGSNNVTLLNPLPLVEWGLDKRYLNDLTGYGLSMPHTISLDRLTGSEALAWADELLLDRVVLKPAWGASGHGVELVARAELSVDYLSSVAAASERPMLMQEYLPEITRGEYALVYFDGEFSHALLRAPASDDFRVNSQYGGSVTLAADIEPELIDFGTKVAAVLPCPAAYLRVDVVRGRDGYVVMEIEANEPGLGLHLAPGSAARFASALLRHAGIEAA